MKLGTFLAVVVAIVMITPWIVNAVKLSNCDFEANYRCEVIHGAGLIPPVAWITVWFDDDKGK